MEKAVCGIPLSRIRRVGIYIYVLHINNASNA